MLSFECIRNNSEKIFQKIETSQRRILGTKFFRKKTELLSDILVKNQIFRVFELYIIEIQTYRTIILKKIKLTQCCYGKQPLSVRNSVELIGFFTYKYKRKVVKRKNIWKYSARSLYVLRNEDILHKNLKQLSQARVGKLAMKKKDNFMLLILSISTCNNLKTFFRIIQMYQHGTTTIYSNIFFVSSWYFRAGSRRAMKLPFSANLIKDGKENHLVKWKTFIRPEAFFHPRCDKTVLSPFLISSVHRRQQIILFSDAAKYPKELIYISIKSLPFEK